MQLEIRILQKTLETCSTEGRANRSDEHSGSSSAHASAYDQSTNHDVVPGVDITARTNVRERRVCRLIQVIHFHNSHAGAVVLALKNSGILAWIERGHDSGLEIVRGRNPRRLHFHLICPPVIVVRDCGGALMQL